MNNNQGSWRSTGSQKTQEQFNSIDNDLSRQWQVVGKKPNKQYYGQKREIRSFGDWRKGKDLEQLQSQQIKRPLTTDPIRIIPVAPITPVINTQRTRINKATTCTHCRWHMEGVSPGMFHDNFTHNTHKYFVKSMIYRYTINFIPERHVIEDDKLFDLFSAGIEYYKKVLMPMGFEKVRFITSRMAKPYCKYFEQNRDFKRKHNIGSSGNIKEHHHLLICFDDEPEKFDEIFGKRINKVIENGILDEELMKSHWAKNYSHYINDSMPLTKPFDSDYCASVNLSEICSSLKSTAMFGSMIQTVAEQSGKQKFDLILSDLYVFMNMNGDDFTNLTLSFGEKPKLQQTFNKEHESPLKSNTINRGVLIPT